MLEVPTVTQALGSDKINIFKENREKISSLL